MCASDQPSVAMRVERPVGRWPTRLLVATALSLAVTSAFAQVDKEQEQVKRLRLQLRQVQQQHTSAQEEQAKADQARQQSEKSLGEAQSELKRLRSSSGATAARAGMLAKETDALKQERDKLQAQVQTLSTQLTELKNQAQAEQTRAQSTEASLKGQNQLLSEGSAKCARHNADLTQIGEDLLARYEHKGMAEVLGESDPFIQTSRVRLENFKSEYQDKIDAARLRVKSAPGSQP